MAGGRLGPAVRALIGGCALLLVGAPGWATLIVNPAQPITHIVNVQLIQVADDAGASPATVLGDASQRATIEGLVDDIWAQAGIDIAFQPGVVSYDDSFALTGTSSPRPTSDLTQIVLDANAAGNVLDPDPLVLDVFFVEVVPGFSFTSDNTANGLAYVGANGIAMFTGSSLLTFQTGREAVASVLAHEIGHNLGLSHVVEDENLMQAGGSPNLGERLDATQISTALSSAYSTLIVPVPEPSPALLLAVGLALLAFRSRRRRQA
jgi:Metallo-peptidase family M12B Reprolysin-like/PEP-CTERM motif